MRRFLTVLIALTIIGAGFVGGFAQEDLAAGPRTPYAALVSLRMIPAKLALLLRPASARAQGDKSLEPVATYFEVMNTIRGDYYGAPPSSTKLTYTAIRGMLKTLNDPYTSFWTPKEYKDQMAETAGNFVGIGAKLDITRDKKVVIVEPIENSPAIKKGVLPGDIIVKVDNKPILGLTLEQVVQRIRGEEGTPVRLTLMRKGHDKFIELSIVRAVVLSPIIEYRMVDEQAGIGYIALQGFNEQADQQFAQALKKLEARGMRALVFDLRNNPGGLLNVAQDIASRFIHEGPLVWVQERNGNKTSLDVEPDKHQSRLEKDQYPVVVLVNGYSASASEIVAGALKDYNIGTLVGTTTFGKGLVQTIIPLPDSSAVKITTQHYFTPKMNDINKKVDETGKTISGGIKPDFVVELTDKDVEAMRNASRDNPSDLNASAAFDPQLKKGVEVLKEKLAGGAQAPPAEGRVTQR